VYSSRRLRGLPLALALVTLLAIGTATARGGMEDRSPVTPQGACVDRATAHRVVEGNSQPSPTHMATLHQYDDYIEDVVSAPDICASNIVTNDNVAITLGVHIHDRAAFAPSDSYRIHVDVDANPATGAPAEAGRPLTGTEYVIDVTDGASSLGAWNGSSFAKVVPQPEISTVWLDGYGPVLEIDRLALGNPTSFNLVVSTGNGADRDLAPDSGSWPYVVTPLRLTAGRLLLGPARAGKPLVAAMEVERSDFEILLDEGAIACRGTVAGKTLAGRGRFAGEIVTCAWRIPNDARGKRASGNVAVTFQGVTAKRSFAVRVK
jgi:hypothetical protein